jgi:hypothetical protein
MLSLTRPNLLFPKGVQISLNRLVERQCSTEQIRRRDCFEMDTSPRRCYPLRNKVIEITPRPWITPRIREEVAWLFWCVVPYFRTCVTSTTRTMISSGLASVRFLTFVSVEHTSHQHRPRTITLLISPTSKPKRWIAQ